jgi:hypothetical protein
VSFLYRPTPVIVLSGWDPAGEVYYPFGLPVADPKKRWYGYGFKGDTTYPRRGGTMEGYTPNMISPALNAIGRRTISGDPWIISSGTMGRFVLGDDLPPDFFDSLSLPPVVPDSSSLPGDFFGSLDSSPIIPTANLPALGPAPSLGIPNLPAAWSGGIPLTYTAPRPPAASSAAQTQAEISAGTSLATNILNFFKPTVKATPMTAAMPGVYKATTVTPSWFQQSNILPGAPNWIVLAGGVLAAVMFASAVGGSRK